jgi:Tat protein secretion system quality control protein TatD with DNase activity
MISNKLLCNITFYIDAHCHLQLSPLYENVQYIMKKAQRIGVQRISICGTCPGDDWNKVADLYTKYPNIIIPNFGLHPWWIKQTVDLKVIPERLENNVKNVVYDWEHELCKWLEEIPIAGVGECGLDKCIKKEVSLDIQEEILKRHIQIALRYQRPLTLHCVNSWGRLHTILQSEINQYINNIQSSDTSSVPYIISNIILHSCNRIPIDMIPLFNSLESTHYISIYYSISMWNERDNNMISNLIKHIPLSRLLIETDSPDQLNRIVPSVDEIDIHNTTDDNNTSDMHCNSTTLNIDNNSIVNDSINNGDVQPEANTSSLQIDLTSNQPGNVWYVYECMLSAMESDSGMTMEKLKQICMDNAFSCFKLRVDQIF